MTEGLKTVEGQIASINSEKRLLAIENRDGIIFYSVSWLPTQDQKIGKLKVGYYVKPTVEVKGDSTGRLIDLPYSERPADWPKSNKGTGNWQPKRPRFTIGFTIPLAQFESVRVDVEGNSPEECKAGLADSIDGLGKNNPAVKDMLQKFKARLL